jgi:hypothetical protein
MNELTVSNNFLFTKDGVESMSSLAQKLSASDIIPQAFQKKPANVLIALDMANRLNASPMMVMQNMYVVYGNPGWSSKFLISTFNMCGKYSPIRYEFFGKPGTDEYGCRAYASELATGEKLTGPDVTIGMAKKEGWYGKNGSKWQTMPQLMLTYRAAAFFIRTCAPEISMGLPTSDELVDVGPVNVTDTGSVKDVVEKVEAETAAAMEQPEVVTPEPAEAPAKPERPF